MRRSPSAADQGKRRLKLLLAAVFCVGCIAAEEEPKDSAGAQVFPVPSDILISSTGIGPIKLGMSLDSISKRAKDLDFARTSDGEGVALVEIALGLDTVIAYTGEDDAAAPVDTSKPVRSLETMTPGFQTAVGIHPGSLVSDAESVYGRITQIQKSEIESREFITFSNQPARMTFRLDHGSGVFDDGSMTTTRLVPRARIFSITVSS